MRISDWSSDVCSSDLPACGQVILYFPQRAPSQTDAGQRPLVQHRSVAAGHIAFDAHGPQFAILFQQPPPGLITLVSERQAIMLRQVRSEEHTSELQSLMRISYAVFCLKKKNKQGIHDKRDTSNINIRTY